MGLILFVTDLFLHLDQHLAAIVRDYGAWTYALLSLIIFAETGFVFTPFLPGDSILFAAGALSATSSLNVEMLLLLLAAAAIAGDTVNYWIGKYFGKYLIDRHSRLLRQEHLDRTHAFFERYGGKTIVIARFVPIVRTFAPFVAGLGAMSYRRFITYNVLGGVLWVVACVGAGYFFGNLPLVRKHFSLVILAIIVISILPGIYGYFSERLRARRQPTLPPRAESADSD